MKIDMSTREKKLKHVSERTLAEVDRARSLFPSPKNLTLALIEEAAEAGREVQKDPFLRGENSLREFTHLGAMAFRLCTEYDPDPDQEALELLDALGDIAEAKQDYGVPEILAGLTKLRSRTEAIEAKYLALLNNKSDDKLTHE